MEKCRRMKRPQFVKELDIFLTMKSPRKTRQQYCRSDRFAMNTDILMNGLMVKKHISLNTVSGHTDSSEKAGPYYHRLKTMVTRSIEQDTRNKNFRARNGNYERNAVVKNQEQNSVYKEFLEIVGNGSPTGSVLEETIAVSDTIWINVQNRHSRILLQGLLRSRMWKMHREPRVLEAEAQVGFSVDCRARITSKEPAQLHSVKEGILRSACSPRQKKCKFGDKCSNAHRQVDELPSKRSKTNGDKSAVAMLKKNEQNYRAERPVVYDYSSNTRQFGLRIPGYGAAEVFVDFAEELTHLANPMCKIHKSRCTSRQHSRPKNIAWSNLPRWSSSA